MLPKNKTMLQIPVEKVVAKQWKDLVKLSETPQGNLFTIMFAGFLKTLQARAEKLNGKKDSKKA